MRKADLVDLLCQTAEKRDEKREDNPAGERADRESSAGKEPARKTPKRKNLSAQKQ